MVVEVVDVVDKDVVVFFCWSFGVVVVLNGCCCDCDVGLNEGC